MKPPGQDEFETPSAPANVPAGELNSSPCPDPSPGGPSDTDSKELRVPRDPLLFIQLNELLSWPHAVEWRETGRWVLFEEKLEVGANRWSIPHVPTLALPSLQKLRSLLAEGLVLLDCPAQNLLELVEQVTRVELLSPELRQQLQALLLQRPQHHIRTIGTRPCWGSSHSRETSHDEEDPLKEQHQNPLREKLPPEAEAGVVLAGELGFLAQPLGAFVRLRDPVVLGPLTEVPLPSRFFCLLLGPPMPGTGYHEMGRAVAVLLSDPQFQWSVRRVRNLHDLLTALDTFLQEVTVLPPGRWDPTARIPPPKCLPSQHKRPLSQLQEAKGPPDPHGPPAENRHSYGPYSPSLELQRTGRLFGGLVQDVHRKASWYPSDFLDALHPQCFSAVLYIYLATITNAITFGGLLGDATEGAQGLLESFLGTAVAGAAFCLMAGQPLTILSSTGPVLVFERLLFSFCRDHNLDYLPFRLWVGIWVATFCLVLVATEASVLVRYFTRFTEEGFCALISLIFIYDAMGKMLSLAHAYPIQRPASALARTPAYGCLCQFPGLGGNESQRTRMRPKDMDDILSMHVKTSRFFPSVKGAGFHLDLFCVAVLMLLTSALGLPWYVSATVISLAHMDSLRKESRACAPGEPPRFLGIREQRLTGLVVFILTGVSIFLAPVLKFIPMPVLYGIFLYMGVAALNSIQFTKRVQLLLMPAKHQPDLLLLRHVPLNRVHLFTTIQLACLGLLWTIKSTPAAIIFPLMVSKLLSLVGVRKALEWVFSQQELLWLDELMAEEGKSIPEKRLDPEHSFSGSDNEDSELMYQPKAPEINISVN
ncbi:anion exchange protein 4 isoform X13 [Choloepus didactylus]|uniref:anion exchange protein 4 isoform X13 n=1 Tax=Choloepus didactylus TaxID=27675 RepID=UPI0018A0284F|nr:anion exchange protein 4 isoform X13 [Choloepus didactylus]